MVDAVRDALNNGLDTLGLVNFEHQIWEYFLLLKKWNKAYNLIANADDITLLGRHIFDSLSARPYIAGQRFIDVGTGAGLPGLLLAVTMPTEEWTLLDANGKKTRFCEQAVMELNLDNVNVVQQRVERFRPDNCYDTVISRAYDQAVDFINSTRHLLCPEGRIVAMKGRIGAEEKAAAAASGLHMEIASLQVPGVQGQRHIMVLT